MKQYCVYCSRLVCGEANHCEKKNKLLSDTTIKSVNKCKYFDFNELNAKNGTIYKPREKNK